MSDKVDMLTVKELIEQLQTMPEGARIRLSVGNPKDSAYTNEIIEVTDDDDGSVTIRGWVSSDNDNAFAPWAPEGDEE